MVFFKILTSVLLDDSFQPVPLWLVRNGVAQQDVVTLTKINKFSRLEFLGIICDDFRWPSKPRYYVLLQELDHH